MKLENQVEQTLREIKLSKKDKILVALSGGKDSTVVAYLLKKFGYEIEGIYVDLKIGDYTERCLNVVRKLCAELKIKLHVYDIKKEQGRTMKQIWEKTQKQKLNNCAVCGVVKKWVLNKEARKLKAKYIATGHNLDDEAQTFLMNIFKGSPQLNANSGPITKNAGDKKFIARIKPLFYILEDDVKKYAAKNKFLFVEGKCPYAQESYRIEVRNFLEKIDKKIKKNMVKNIQKIQPFLEKKKFSKIRYCEFCGEPSRNEICKKCELLKI